MVSTLSRQYSKEALAIRDQIRALESDNCTSCAVMAEVCALSEKSLALFEKICETELKEQTKSQVVDFKMYQGFSSTLIKLTKFRLSKPCV